MNAFANPSALFEERQKFTQAWLWALVLVPVLIALPIILLAPKPPGAPGLVIAVVVPLALGLPVVIFASAAMTTTVTPAELRLRYVPFFVDKRIPVTDIVRFTPMSCSAWQTGYGIHYSRFGWVYNVSGGQGIQFELRDGKRLLIGTQRSLEFAAALQQVGAKPS